MGDHGASEEREFGKEVGLMSEVIVTGRKVGADREFWKALAHDQNLFQIVVETVKAQQTAFLRKLIIEWEEFYRKDGIEVDFSNLRIPVRRKGFNRLLVIAQGLKIKQVFDNCAKISFEHKVDIDKNLDEVINKNDRDPANGAYAIWVRDRVEADEELTNLSADDLKRKKISGITLLERILYGRKYHKETGNNLDIKDWTLCSGSLSNDGYVPLVGGDSSGMWFNWCGPDHHRNGLCARAVVA